MSPREKEIYEAVLNVLIESLQPKKIILFGSRAKNRSVKSSDFDFAVEEPVVKLNELQNLDEKIEEVSGLYGVDVIDLSEVDDAFRQIVYDTGKVVYESRN